MKGDADEREAGGVGVGGRGVGEGDEAVLQGLAEGFEGIAAELGQLVQEEDAVVGEADLSRAAEAAAADEAGIGDGVMGGAEGTASEKGLAGGEAGEPHLGREADSGGGRAPGAME